VPIGLSVCEEGGGEAREKNGSRFQPCPGNQDPRGIRDDSRVLARSKRNPAPAPFVRAGEAHPGRQGTALFAPAQCSCAQSKLE